MKTMEGADVLQQKVLCEAVTGAGTGLRVCSVPPAGKLPVHLLALSWACRHFKHFSHYRATPAGGLRDHERGCVGRMKCTFDSPQF